MKHSSLVVIILLLICLSSILTQMNYSMFYKAPGLTFQMAKFILSQLMYATNLPFQFILLDQMVGKRCLEMMSGSCITSIIPSPQPLWSRKWQKFQQLDHLCTSRMVCICSWSSPSTSPYESIKLDNSLVNVMPQG